MRQKLIIFVIFHLLFFAHTESKAQIVINEILASNTSTNLNEQNKQFGDWIELYNDSDKEISIAKWYLSDTKKNPTKWEIPFYISIAPKGFQLFWADNTNTTNHTNFRLNIEGETIYLFNKDLVLVDSLNYPPQVPDIAYGRINDSESQFVYFDEATPMKENPLFGNKTVIFSEEPQFSEQAGFYEKSVKLELSGASDTEKIYYTLDGSKPTKASNHYSQPIDINKTTTIRARTYAENKLASKVITQSYLIKESVSLPVVSLAIDPSYLWDKNYGIYVEGSKFIEDVWESANFFQEWERPIHVEYFDSNGEVGFEMDAGVRIHGRSTRNHAQKTLAIFAREKYGTPSIPYKLFGERSADNMNSFLLRNGGNDWGRTMFLDGLIHSLLIDKVDIDAQLYQPSIVFLNGEYWGIHNIREKINEHYVKNKHPNDSSKLDIIEAVSLGVDKLEACYGSMDEYNEMIEFIEHNELSIKENYDSVKQWIDINEFINYVATQVYICNKDWPNSNMKFWKYRDESSKWRWILYDTEFSFIESNKFAQFNMLEHIFAENSELYTTLPWANYIVRKLFENDEFKFEFIQRLAVYLNTLFASDRVLHVIDSLKANIEPEVARNLTKWGGIKQRAIPFFLTSKNTTEWEGNINHIKKFVENRAGVLRENMLTYFKLKDTVSLKLKVNDRKAGSIALMGYPLEEGQFEGFVFTDLPIRMEAIPNEGYEFVKWNGGEEEQQCVLYLQEDKKLTAIFRKIK